MLAILISHYVDVLGHECLELSLEPLSNAFEHGVATHEQDIIAQINPAVHIRPLDRALNRLLDRLAIDLCKPWLEHYLRTSDAQFTFNCDFLGVWQRVLCIVCFT